MKENSINPRGRTNTTVAECPPSLPPCTSHTHTHARLAQSSLSLYHFFFKIPTTSFTNPQTFQTHTHAFTRLFTLLPSFLFLSCRGNGRDGEASVPRRASFPSTPSFEQKWWEPFLLGPPLPSLPNFLPPPTPLPNNNKSTLTFISRGTPSPPRGRIPLAPHDTLCGVFVFAVEDLGGIGKTGGGGKQIKGTQRGGLFLCFFFFFGGAQ